MFSACVFRFICTIIWFLGWDNLPSITICTWTIRNQSSRFYKFDQSGAGVGHYCNLKRMGENFSFHLHPSAQETTRPVKYCISLKPQNRVLINILFSKRALCKMPRFCLILAVFWHWRNIFETNKILIKVLCCVIDLDINSQPIQLRFAQYCLNINTLFMLLWAYTTPVTWNKKCKVSGENSWLCPHFFGYQITQNAFIAASVKLPSFHSHTIFSHFLLLHFGSLHLGFQDFLEKEMAD